MGLIYDPRESRVLVDALVGILGEARRVLGELESANGHLVECVGGGGELSGRAYSVVGTVFAQGAAVRIADVWARVDGVQGDLGRYVWEDSKVSPLGVLREDGLEGQLAATRAQRDATVALIDANRSVALGVRVLPGLGEALLLANRKLEWVLAQLENNIRELEDCLRALWGFETATRGLFQGWFSGGEGAAGVTRTVRSAEAAVSFLGALGSMSPAEVAMWWKTLTDAQRRQYVTDMPEVIGNLDGLPAKWRSVANQAALKRYAAELARVEKGSPGYEQAQVKLAAVRAIQKRLGKDPEKQNPPLQLVMVDLLGKVPRAAIAVGNMDTADHVTFNIPGMNTTVAKNMAGWTNVSENLYWQQQFADRSRGGSGRVAVVAWIGYDSPQDFFGENGSDRARAGGRDLAKALTGTLALRGWPPQSTHLAVVGFSYGSAVAGEALKYASAGSFVSLGSAGIPTNAQGKKPLNVPRGGVSAGEASADFAAMGARIASGRRDPSEYGAVPFSTDEGRTPEGARTKGTTNHDASIHGSTPNGYGYYDQKTTSLYNMALQSLGYRDKLAK